MRAWTLLPLVLVACAHAPPAPPSPPPPAPSPAAPAPDAALDQRWREHKQRLLDDCPPVLAEGDALEEALGDPALRPHAARLRALYGLRLGGLVFWHKGRLTKAGQRARALLDQAWTHGAPSVGPPLDALEALREAEGRLQEHLEAPLPGADQRRLAPDAPLELAALSGDALRQLEALEEARLAIARRALALDAALVAGLWRLGVATGLWPDPGGGPVEALLYQAPEAALDGLGHPSEEYHRLRGALARYAALARAGGLPTLPADAPALLSIGDRHAAVRAMRARLAAEGFGDPAPQGDPEVFDPALAAPLRAFQVTRGISPTALVDGETRAALQAPAEALVARLLLGLRRWQRSPTRRTDYYLRVNAARFEVQLVQQGRALARYPVVVGRPQTPTPRFEAVVDHIQVHPWWWGVRGQPRRVSPGPHNPLGELVLRVNPRHRLIYLHGTNEPALLSRDRRAFSHGCVRLEHPRRLAALILEQDPGGDDTRTLEALLRLGATRELWLQRPVPVFFEYNTTFVDPQTGHAHFVPDLYQDDARLLREAPLDQEALRALTTSR